MLTMKESGCKVKLGDPVPSMNRLTAFLPGTRELANVVTAGFILVESILNIQENIDIALGHVLGLDNVVASRSGPKALGPLDLLDGLLRLRSVCGNDKDVASLGDGGRHDENEGGLSWKLDKIVLFDAEVVLR